MTHQEGATSRPPRACGKECLAAAELALRAQSPEPVAVHARLSAPFAPGSGELSIPTTPQQPISKTQKPCLRLRRLGKKRTRSRFTLSHVLPRLKQALPATVGKTGGRVQCAWLELKDLTLTLSDKSQTKAFSFLSPLLCSEMIQGVVIKTNQSLKGIGVDPDSGTPGPRPKLRGGVGAPPAGNTSSPPHRAWVGAFGAGSRRPRSPSSPLPLARAGNSPQHAAHTSLAPHPHHRLKPRSHSLGSLLSESKSKLGFKLRAG